jgi:hypothetical protein
MAVAQIMQGRPAFRFRVAADRCPGCGGQSNPFFGTPLTQAEFTSKHAGLHQWAPLPTNSRTGSARLTNADRLEVHASLRRHSFSPGPTDGLRSAKARLSASWRSAHVLLQSDPHPPSRHASRRRHLQCPHAAVMSEREALDKPDLPQSLEDRDQSSLSFDRKYFPLASIVGNESAKKALLIAAIDPKLGGVAIAGPRGTAKTVMARGFPALLPPIEVVVGSWANADPRKEEEWESGLQEKLGSLEKEGRGIETQWREVPFVQVTV